MTSQSVCTSIFRVQTEQRLEMRSLHTRSIAAKAPVDRSSSFASAPPAANIYMVRR